MASTMHASSSAHRVREDTRSQMSRDDNTTNDTTSTDLEPVPMLMIHGSHFAVSWYDGNPRVEARIPSTDEEIAANSLFVPTSSTLSKRGGKTFKATFVWEAGAMQDGHEEEKDVMLCYVGECHDCDNTVPAGTTTNRRHGKPFVHSCCVKVVVGAHNFNVFTPKGNLKADYPLPFPTVMEAQVVFDDGESRDVFMCVATACAFCSAVSKGKSPPRGILTQSEKEMVKDRKEVKKMLEDRSKRGWVDGNKVGGGDAYWGKGMFARRGAP